MQAGKSGRIDVGEGAWIECSDGSGVVMMHDPRLFRAGREAFCRALARSAVQTYQARRVLIDFNSCLCRLDFGPARFDRSELSRRVTAALSEAIPTLRTGVTRPTARGRCSKLTARAGDRGCTIRQWQGSRSGRVVTWDTPLRPQPVPRPHIEVPRWRDLALFGGSLTMAVAGVILPGIPSLPFLVLSAHHAVRLSPRMEAFLRRQTWSVTLLERSQAPGGVLHIDRGTLPKMLLVTAVAAPVLLVVRPPLPVLIGLEAAIMAYACVRAIGRSPVEAKGLGLVG
jgi:uncharacterized membrane protein YbaN (DUF454 family)